MRYSSSMLIATMITLLVFLGMSLLIASPKFKKSTQIEMVNFSKVADMRETVSQPPKPKTPPKQVKVKHPPATPPLDISTETSRPSEIFPPLKGVKTQDFHLSQYDLPTVSMGTGDTFGDKNGELTPIFVIQPIYPHVARSKNIEGWVKVEFVVNEFGKVNDIKIIDAHPHRIFDSATKRALLKSKFKPLVIDGKAVSQKAIQVVEFKLTKD